MCVRSWFHGRPQVADSVEKVAASPCPTSLFTKGSHLALGPGLFRRRTSNAFI